MITAATIQASKAPAKVVSKPHPVVETKPKKSHVQVEFNTAPPKPHEEQNASILATRMTGGYSGWSAPPTVFKEKTLLEIEAEKRLKEAEEIKEKNEQVNWMAKTDDEG